MFTGIEINDIRLPSSANQVYKLKQNSTLFDVGVPKGEWTMPISLEMDDVTMRALGLQHRINFKDKFNRTECRLYDKGVFVRNGLLVIEEIGDQITGYILTGMSTLAEQMRTTYLDDVNYGTVIVPGTTEAQMVAHMKDTVDNPNSHNHVFAPIVSKGFIENFVNKNSIYDEMINIYISNNFLQNSEARVNDTPHVPFPKLIYVLKKIHEQFGFTLEWPLMSDTTFANIAMVNNKALLEDIFLNDLKLKSDTTNDIFPLFPAITGGYEGIVQDTKIDRVDVTPPVTSEGIMPSHVLKYNNALIDIDTPSPYTNEYGQFDTANGRYLINASGKMNITLVIQASFFSAADLGFEGQFYMFEISVNGQRLDYDISYFDLTMPLANFTNTFQYTFNLYDVDISPELVGYYMDFKVGAYAETENEESNGIHFLNSTRFKMKVHNLEIDHSRMNAYQRASYDIDYANHLEHITCSDFLASIRNRFGAYVSNINLEDKIVTYAMLKDVAMSNAENRFNLRNEKFSKKSVQQSHKWKYNFDNGEEALWSKFFNKTIGDANAEITHNEYSFDMGPVFYEDHKIWGWTPSKAMSGISKAAVNTEVNNYLAIYHGLRIGPGSGPYRPVITSQNNIIEASWVDASPWGLHWKESDGLYVTFLEDFWKYFVEYMEIEFTVFPDTVEILQFKYENVDFYNFMKFLVKEIDFEISKEKMRPTKAVMVKLDI